MAARTLLYSDVIRLRSQANPCVSGLVEHMKIAPRSASTVVLLEYPLSSNLPSSPVGITKTELPRLLHTTSPATGRVIFIENIGPDLISYLGQSLEVDPLFFAGHVSTDFQDFEKAPLPPSLALLPSQIAERGYLHIHYQQVIDLGSAEQFRDTAYALRTDSNVPRNARRVPHLSGRQLAITRGCCSIFLKKLKDSWYGEFCT